MRHEVSNGASLRHDFAVDYLLLRQNQQSEPRFVAAERQRSLPGQIATAKDQMRQNETVISDAARWWKVRLDVVGFDRITRG